MYSAEHGILSIVKVLSTCPLFIIVSGTATVILSFVIYSYFQKGIEFTKLLRLEASKK